MALEAIAKERKIDNNEAALAWLLARSPVMLPIPGTSQVKHLEDNVGAAKIKLTPDEMARVGEARSAERPPWTAADANSRTVRR